MHSLSKVSEIKYLIQFWHKMCVYILANCYPVFVLIKKQRIIWWKAIVK